MSLLSRGICGFRSSRITLASPRDSPNLAPRPAMACAVAVSVRFSLIGSTFPAIDVTVSKRVLNSVVTDSPRITSLRETGTADGCFGDVNDTYLLPKTVLALTSARTFDGIDGRYWSF